MARYQIPPDPRQDDSTTPHARKVSGDDARSSPPWLWIGLGAIVTVLAVAVAVLWARLLLDVKPADIAATPTAILRTAVPTSPSLAPTTDSAPSVASTRTTVPDSEPTIPGEPTATPAGAIAVGARVVVAGTGGAGVSLRAGPGTDNARLGLANDGDILEIIRGPEEGGDFTWWFVLVEDGTEAWVVEDYLEVP